MIGDIPFASFANGISVVALVLVFGWMLATGKLATSRELKEKNAEIKWLRQRNEELSDQNSIMLHESLPVTSKALTAIHKAADQAMKEDEQQ